MGHETFVGPTVAPVPGTIDHGYPDAFVESLRQTQPELIDPALRFDH